MCLGGGVAESERDGSGVRRKDGERGPALGVPRSCIAAPEAEEGEERLSKVSGPVEWERANGLFARGLLRKQHSIGAE